MCFIDFEHGNTCFNIICDDLWGTIFSLSLYVSLFISYIQVGSTDPILLVHFETLLNNLITHTNLLFRGFLFALCLRGHRNMMN